MASIPPDPNLTGPAALSEAEVLPPVSGYVSPQQMQEPVKRRRRTWAAAPATHILLAINCLVFLAMLARGISAVNPGVDQLMDWGANNAGAVLNYNGYFPYAEWWRIVTAMFLHVGILHLGLNMWCLWNLGLLAEPLMGSFGLFAAYILTGAAGNLLSTLLNWVYPMHEGGNIVFPAGAGASGAVFGIAGALIVLLKSNRLPVPPVELKKLRKSVIYFAAVNLVIGFSITFGTHVIGSGLNIDNMAHLGGFVGGLLFAAPMVPRIGSARNTFNVRLRAAVILLLGVLVLFGFYIAHVPPPQA